MVGNWFCCILNHKRVSVASSLLTTATMASAAAAKANPYSLTNTNPHKIGFSHKFSIKIPFFPDSSSPRLVAVHSNNPNLDSIEMDKAVSGLGSGPGNPESSHASPSPSSAIDFLTLCHRLKVSPNFVRYWFHCYVCVYGNRLCVCFAHYFVKAVLSYFSLSLSLSKTQTWMFAVFCEFMHWLWWCIQKFELVDSWEFYSVYGIRHMIMMLNTLNCFLECCQT